MFSFFFLIAWAPIAKLNQPELVFTCEPIELAGWEAARRSTV
jgi:hypothetical protein